MISRKLFILLISLCFQTFENYAQFGIPTEICPVNAIDFTSPDSAIPIHQWDFCTGDLLETPIAINMFTHISGTIRPEAMKLVSDGTNWYGFITSVSHPILVRADFGDDLNNTPSFQVLAPIGMTTNCYNLSFINSWYSGVFFESSVL